MAVSASLLATTSTSPPTLWALLMQSTIGEQCLDDLPCQAFNLPLQGSLGSNQRPGQTGLCQAHAEAAWERVQVKISILILTMVGNVLNWRGGNILIILLFGIAKVKYLRLYFLYPGMCWMRTSTTTVCSKVHPATCQGMRFSTFLVSPKLFTHWLIISTFTTVVDNEIVEVLEESHWSDGEGEESWKCLVYQIRPASSA